MWLGFEEIKLIASNQLTAEEVVILKLLVTMTQRQAAAVLGVSHQYIQQTSKRAHAKLMGQGEYVYELDEEDEDDL
jgi:DNA-directed RNA polymerase specialized sigma subunit